MKLLWLSIPLNILYLRSLLMRERYPNKWLWGYVCPIFKKKDDKSFSNEYRSVSLNAYHGDAGKRNLVFTGLHRQKI